MKRQQSFYHPSRVCARREVIIETAKHQAKARPGRPSMLTESNVEGWIDLLVQKIGFEGWSLLQVSSIEGCPSYSCMQKWSAKGRRSHVLCVYRRWWEGVCYAHRLKAEAMADRALEVAKLTDEETKHLTNKERRLLIELLKWRVEELIRTYGNFTESPFTKIQNPPRSS